MAKKMTDDELLALGRQELETADTQGTNAIREQRITSFDIYIGELRDRLVASTGLSSVLLNEHFDYTNRLTTYILNSVAGDKEVTKFMTNNMAKAGAAKQLEEMVNFCIMRLNDGFYNFEEWIRSACISKVGIVKYWWDTTPKSWEEEVDIGQGDINLFINQKLNEMGDDVEIEIIGKPNVTEVLSSETEIDEDGIEYDTPPTPEVVSAIYTLRFTTHGRPMWEAIPREEFITNVECVGLRDDLTRFNAHRREMMVGDVVSMYPDVFRKIARNDGTDIVEAATSVATDGDTTNNYDYDYERINRFAWDGTYDVTDSEESTDPLSRRIQLVEGYYKVDYEKKGRLVWLRMVWAGNQIFEKEIVEDHPFCSFAPFPVPHKFDGQSVYDVIESTMRAQTGLLRSKIDNSVQRNIVRFLVDSNMNRGVTANLQQGKPGPIAVKNLANSGVQILETPQGSNDTVAILQYLDQKISAKIGISSVNDGTNVDLLKSGNDEAKVQAVQSQATQNVEMYVRRLAETGIKDLIFGFTRMLLANPDSYFVRDLVMRMYGPQVPFIAVQQGMDFKREDLCAQVGIGHANKQEKMQAHQDVFQMMGAAEAAGISIPPAKKLKWLEDGIRMRGVENAYDYIPTIEEFQQAEQAKAQDPMTMLAQEAQKAELEKQIHDNEKTKSETVENYAQADKAHTDAFANVAEFQHEDPFRTQ